VSDAPERGQRAEAAWRLGMILADTSRYGEARRLWDVAMRESDDPNRIAEIRRGLAIAAVYSGQTDEAVDHESGGQLSISGVSVRLNAGTACPAAARAGDSVASGVIASGSSTVCIG
jgi:hypothetical protein